MDPSIAGALISSAVTLLIGIPTFIAIIVAVRELRETARQNRVLTYQQTINTEHELFRMIGKDPKGLRLCLGTSVQVPSDPDERESLLGTVFLFDFYERIYYEHEIGAFPKALWPGWTKHILYVIKDPEVANLWDVVKDDYYSPFRDYVEKNR